MRVLMFGWEFPPFISGGLGTACHGLTQGMTEEGAEIIFVLPHLRGRKNRDSHVQLVAADEVSSSKVTTRRPRRKRRVEGQGIRHIEIDAALQPYLTDAGYRELVERLRVEEEEPKASRPQGKFLSILPLSGDYGRDLVSEVFRYAEVGKRLGAEEDFDIIHAHDWMTYPAGIEAKHASGKLLVVHVHATEFDRCGEHVNQAVYDIERRGMHEADLVIAVSHRTKELVVARYGVPAEKVAVVHNAVTKEKTVERWMVRKNPREKIVLFLGRVTMQKGPDYFVEAASRVLKRMKDVRFVMAGTGDMMPRMIERMAVLRMTPHFHFTGFLQGRRIEEMYAMSDLFVMPSVSEPFGITPFEAAKHGVPVILSKQSGVAEVLDGVIKIDFWDVEKMADSIVEVLSKPKLSQQLVEDNYRTLGQVDWKNAAQAVITQYQKLLNG